MKKRKLNHIFLSGMLSLSVLLTGIPVSAQEFSEDTSEETEQFSVETDQFSSEAAMASSAISISTSAFPDQIFRSYILKNVDTNQDKKLSSTEIGAFKKMDLKGLGISNLKGIEYFTSLTELNASGNKLKSVNLTKNSKLTFINVSKNSLSGTLDLRKCLKMKYVVYSHNSLKKVLMPDKKYLKSLDYIDASYNKFTSQADAGLSVITSRYIPNFTQIDASNNRITSFNCSGFEGILDLSNNKITKLSGGSEGYQAAALYLEGNSLSQTSSIDFTPEWVKEPQRFSCDSSVKKKVKMIKAKLSAQADWSKITLNVGSSSQDAVYKLERKTGNGAYKTIKVWNQGELNDPEFGDDFTDTSVTAGTTYTYRLTASVQIQDRNKKNQTWSNNVTVTARAAASQPSISVASSKKRTATVTWKAVSGANAYEVYYGTSNKSVKTAVTGKNGTTKLSVNRTKLKSGKTYYFRVRAFKLVNGKKIYTSYSSVKGVKVK
ncbi:MAG: leucine-rich repeat domain-containing protein [Blautia sp.]|nr:leucine-rich repeat domain-containing protein [Blautia sp.]